MLSSILNILVKFQNQNPNIYVGGSVSLILQNIIPYRVPKDIDIITPNRIHIYELFNVNDKPKHPVVRRYRYSDLLFELFINPQAQYIEHIYNGHIIKLSPADEIYEWKKRERNINNKKHSDDLKYYETFF
jgi:hypothetical protein